MIVYSVTEYHRITKTKMLKSHWSPPGKYFPQNVAPSLLPPRAKIVIHLQVVVFEKFIPPAERGTLWGLKIKGKLELLRNGG